MNGIRVDECDLEPKQAAMRLLVDQLNALLGETLQLELEIGHLVGDVMHAGAAVGEKLADRRFIAERREQLNAAFADSYRGGFNTLLGNGVAVLDLSTEEPPIGVEGFVEILDGQPEMVNPLRLHARGS